MGTISVNNLGKAYKQYPTRWSRLLEWITLGNAKRHQLKRVLQDINFSVNAGEAVGIIGINGAGKSTLLKLITGTTMPTTGSVHMTGRVAAMLELGMGFHPDFTGRQNAFMAGQLLGISSQDIARLMPEIEAFAEIGDYIDQPVRVYSSGMQMRLAFSVATAIRPDILIVDEALSVGDAYFQHKSFDRIRDFRKRGTTLLIVSHDKHAIQTICDRAILLDAGRIVKQGEPESVMDFYNALIAIKGNESISQFTQNDGKTQTLSGTGEVTVVDASLRNENNEAIEIVPIGSKVSLNIKVKIHSKIPQLVLGYKIKDRLGLSMFGTNTFLKKMQIELLDAGEIVEFQFKFPFNLGVGSYSISIALHESDNHLTKNYFFLERALIINAINVSHENFEGCAWIDPIVSISRKVNKSSINKT